MKNCLKKYWRGEEKLWKAFWLSGLVVIAFIIIVNYGLSHLIAQLLLGRTYVKAIEVIDILLIVYWGVLAWKCSGNTTRSAYKYASRVGVVLTILLVSYTHADIHRAVYRIDKINHPIESNNCLPVAVNSGIHESFFRGQEPYISDPKDDLGFSDENYIRLHDCVVETVATQPQDLPFLFKVTLLIRDIFN